MGDITEQKDLQGNLPGARGPGEDKWLSEIRGGGRRYGATRDIRKFRKQ